MAYETGNALNTTDLLDKIRIFALAQGWTSNRFSAITGGYWLNLSKGAQFVNLTSHDVNGTISGQGATSYDSGSAHTAQPGRISTNQWAVTNDLVGPYTGYHFFGGADYIHVVVQVSPGRYAHFGFGTLLKYGAYTGGEYVYGTWWSFRSVGTFGSPNSTYHSPPFDATYSTATSSSHDGGTYFTMVRFAEAASAQGSWLRTAQSVISGYATGFSRATNTSTPTDSIMARQPAVFNGMSQVVPIHISAVRNDTLVSWLGSPKDMRQFRMYYHEHGDVLAMGQDEWIVFPLKFKYPTNASVALPSSGVYGLAYRKF